MGPIEYLRLNLQNCNYVGFDRAYTWYSAIQLMCAVLGCKCGVERAWNCRYVSNWKADTFNWIFQAESAKLQIRWLGQSTELTQHNPNDVRCIWLQLWSITCFELSTYHQQQRRFVQINIEAWIWRTANTLDLTGPRFDIAFYNCMYLGFYCRYVDNSTNAPNLLPNTAHVLRCCRWHNDNSIHVILVNCSQIQRTSARSRHVNSGPCHIHCNWSYDHLGLNIQLKVSPLL
jgi:hypothetical protein